MSKSSTLTRRALVASTAAMPAAAAAALAMPSAAIADPAGSDDALLRLGAELERIGQEWLAQRAIDRQERAAFEAACEAAGLPWIVYGSISDKKFWAYQDKRSSLRSENKKADVDEHGESIAWNSIHGPMFALIDDILGHKAQTIAGLAVQAHAVVLDNAEWWDDDGNDECRPRLFLESACAFLGIMPAPIQEAAARSMTSIA